MTDSGDTMPMFEIPEKYRPPAKPPKAVTWTAYNGARTSCDTCLANIAQGTNQHFAEPAAWVRTTPERRQYFCYRHGHHEKMQDELGTRKVITE